MIKKLFNEMPHINYGDKIFDLQYEDIRNPEQLLSFLESILNGKKYVDKYGDEIFLKDRNERIKFLNGLKNNDTFINIVDHKFNDNEKRLFVLLLDSYS
jgi:hypothetical protein